MANATREIQSEKVQLGKNFSYYTLKIKTTKSNSDNTNRGMGIGNTSGEIKFGTYESGKHKSEDTIRNIILANPIRGNTNWPIQFVNTVREIQIGKFKSENMICKIQAGKYNS